MTVIREGNLEFSFGSSWDVCKYDGNGSYYKSLMEKNVKPTKAVDFLCLCSGCPLLMLEVKDFSRSLPNRERFENIPMSVAIKARDTIAGIIGGLHCSSDVEQTFFKTSYKKMEIPPRVIFFFEDLATPARPPQRVANKRDVLQKKLREHLRWLTRNIVVVGLNDYSRFINDLRIRQV